MYQELINKLNLMHFACGAELEGLKANDAHKLPSDEVRKLITRADMLSGKLDIINELLRWTRARMEESING